jgi:hypothetical protein
MRALPRILAPFGVLAVLSLPGASVRTQDGPSRQVLPEGIRGGPEVVTEARVEIRHDLFQRPGD